MQKICIKTPTTFYSSDKFINVNDDTNFLFYFHPNKSLFIKLNLPPGCYYTDNKLQAQAVFEPYPFIEDANIPKDEIKDTRIVLGSNPNKASIYPAHGFIIMDNGLNLLKYKPAKSFVLGHELGHYYFGADEDKCDDYSYNVMNRAGFNPSQVYLAAKMLFQKNPARAKRLIDKLIDLKTRR